MTTDGTIKIAYQLPGPGTGDVIYVSEDGRQWKKWDGVVKTGEEVRRLSK